MAVLSNIRCPLRPFLAPNHAPWHADVIGAGRAQHDQGGKQEANGGKLVFIRAVQAFPCHGGGSAAFLFNSTDFYVTHRFFGAVKERKVLPQPP